jgi:hypothetical protein
MKSVRHLIQQLLHSRVAIAVLVAMPGMGLLLLLVQALIGGINREVVVGVLFGAFSHAVLAEPQSFTQPSDSRPLSAQEFGRLHDDEGGTCPARIAAPVAGCDSYSAGQGNPPYEPGTDREKALRDWLEPVADLIDLTLEESQAQGRSSPPTRPTVDATELATMLHDLDGEWKSKMEALRAVPGEPMSRPCAMSSPRSW